MVAFAFSLPYHVLRTAAAAGFHVHVLGNGPSHGLKKSRYCASYRTSAAWGNDDNDPELILAEICEIVRERGIDLVFPSDDVSTRLLAAIRGRLPVATTLLPELVTFDLLNDKWNFSRFARDQGARIPETRLYESLGELKLHIQSGILPLPLTLKPTNRSGGIGVVHIRDKSELTQLAGLNYQPILVQQHIIGETIGISVLCKAGKILVHAIQRRDENRFQLFSNRDLFENAEKIVAASGLDGPAHFDAILESATGLTYVVECNPRFWFTMYMSMIVGFNFVAYARGTAGSVFPDIARLDGEIRLSAKAILARPWRTTRQDWAHFVYQFGDPLAYLALRRRQFDDRDIAVEAARMTPYPQRQPKRAPGDPPMLVA
jgi:biotin carboxylase